MIRRISLVLLLLCGLAVPLHTFLGGRDLFVTPLFLALLYGFAVSVVSLPFVLIVSGVRAAAAASRGRPGALRRKLLPPTAATLNAAAFLLVSAVAVLAVIVEAAMVRLLTPLLPVLLLMPHAQYSLRARLWAHMGILAAALFFLLILPPTAANVISWLVAALSVVLCVVAVHRAGAGMTARLQPQRVLLGVFLPVAAVFCLLFLVRNVPRPDTFAMENVVYGPLLPIWEGSSDTTFYGLNVSAEEARVYVSDYGTGPGGLGNVGYVDLATGRVRLGDSIATDMAEIVLDRRRSEENGAETRLLFVYTRQGILTLDRDSLEELHRFPDLPIGNNLAVTPTPRYLAAVLEFDPRVYWVDLDTWSSSAYRVPVLVPYHVMCSDPRGRCYVSGWWHSTRLAEVRVGEDGLPQDIRGLFLGPYSLAMAWLPGHDRLLVLRPLAGALDVIDTEAFRRVQRIRIPPMVRILAYWPEADVVFLPGFFAGTVHMLRLSTGKEVGRFQVGRQAGDIVWDEELASLFVLDQRAVYRFTREALIGRFPLLATR